MGNTTSSNEIDKITRSAIQVANTADQKCFTPAQVSNTFIASGNRNTKIGAISQKNAVNFSANCGTKTRSDSSVFEDIKAQIAQESESLRSTLVATGNTTSDNAASLTTELETEIINAISQTCKADLTANNVIEITNEDNVQHGPIDQELYMEHRATCVMDTINNSQVTKEISQIVDQKSSATAESELGSIIAAIAVVMVVGGLLFYMITTGGGGGGGGGKVTKYLIIAVIALLVLGILGGGGYYLYTRQQEPTA